MRVSNNLEKGTMESASRRTSFGSSPSQDDVPDNILGGTKAPAPARKGGDDDDDVSRTSSGHQITEHFKEVCSDDDSAAYLLAEANQVDQV
jgi:hypothetical protein